MAASEHVWMAGALVVCLACAAHAQQLTYGQDAVADSNHVESLMHGYGTDHVPASAYHPSVYVLGYGHDASPGTSTRDNLRTIVAGQSAQVLTSAGPRSSGTPSYRPRLFRRWR
jgi:hypothetical protein